MMHIPVLLNEVLNILEPQAEYTYIDGTLGMGGHAASILKQAGSSAHLIGIDRDPQSLQLAKQNLSTYPNCEFINARFGVISQILQENKFTKPLAGILLDLGISSYQMDSAHYGLSFQNTKQNLDMRLDPWCSYSAGEILNTWPEKKIADLFWDLADYPQARKLAKLIVQNRPLNSIGDLVELCQQLPARSHHKLGAATLPLMALRIAVNDELAEIEHSLESIIQLLEPGVKIVVISFHSGEDRIIKYIFKKYQNKLKILMKKTFESNCPRNQK